MHNFSPIHGIAGGILIGLSASYFLIVNGRVAGISGMLEGLLSPKDGHLMWRLAFLSGLPLGALLVGIVRPELVPTVEITNSNAVLIVGGILVGLGARIANGCTSGHGVCGLPRRSMRSIVATVSFFATAAMTVLIARHIF